MEMTTTFRYERTVPRAAALHRALARQNATIKDAEKLAADKAAINELVGTNQVAIWSEDTGGATETQIFKRYKEAVSQELKAAQTQLLRARRENLRHLLDLENTMYLQELEPMGLTYFKCRI